jgi:hypothetical protein
LHHAVFWLNTNVPEEHTDSYSGLSEECWISALKMDVISSSKKLAYIQIPHGATTHRIAIYKLYLYVMHVLKI